MFSTFFVLGMRLNNLLHWTFPSHPCLVECCARFHPLFPPYLHKTHGLSEEMAPQQKL